MTYITYKEMVMRFGKPTAHTLIRTLEKLTIIHNQIVMPIDQEERLKRALQALNDNPQRQVLTLF